MENKKYQIIYADPPWCYKDKALTGNRGAGCKYNVMSNIDLINMSEQIKSISDINCCLFMWVTMPKLNECFELIKAWGFVYKTVAFTWIKQNKVSDTYFMGMGRWTRANAELCLIVTKGKPKRINAGISSLIISHRGKHSQKPNEVREKKIKLCGDIPRIELFARENVEGWDCWGNEVESDIKLF